MLKKKWDPAIVFFGTPDFAVASLKALLAHDKNVVAVVTAPDKPAGRGRKPHFSAVKSFAVEAGLPVWQPEKLKNPDFLQKLRSAGAELFVVVAFRMLPEVVWNMPPGGTLNVHASLLPQYRGAAPINWAIIRGERMTGVTTFKLKHEIDTGDILLQKSVAIAADDDFGSLYQKLMHEGAALLVETIDGLGAGQVAPQRQLTDSPLKTAPKLFKEDAQIHWDRPALDIYNLIRGLSPHPAAYTFLEGKQLKVFKAAVGDPLSHVAPGTFDTDGRRLLRVAAQDRWVDLLEVQLEGKRRMPSSDFLKGYRFSRQ